MKPQTHTKLDMDRGISKALWQLLKPDDEKFSLPPDDPGDAFWYDDFLQSGYTTKADEPECGWTPFSREGLSLPSSLNVTKSTRIIVEGRFRPIGNHATLLLVINEPNNKPFWAHWTIEETTKFGFMIDGQKNRWRQSINGSVDATEFYFTRPFLDCQVCCLALGGETIECDWLVCAEVQI